MRKQKSGNRWISIFFTAIFFLAGSVAGAADKVVVIPFFSHQNHADLTKYTNSIGMTFSKIPAGSFIMGSPDGLNGRAGDSHRPFWSTEFGEHIENNEVEIQHIVAITTPFYMQTTEVTQKQFLMVMQSSGYTNPSHFSGCGQDCPVENVSWADANLFIDLLNTRENRSHCDSLPNTCYSLPTEAQWEYSARAGTVTAFYSGTISSSTHSDCSQLDSNLDAIGWYCANSDNTTHLVALKKPNNWGLYDMSGNVEEWCQDRSNSGIIPEEDMQYPAEDLTFNTIPVNDPTGRSTGSHRVSRGGSWDHDARSARSAKRYHHSPTGRFSTLGFRVVLPFAK